MSKVKKRTSLAKRLLSVLLVLLLCMSMASIGISSVSAREYYKGASAKVLNLEIGDYFEEGTSIKNLNFYDKKVYRKMIAYLDGEFYQETDTAFVFDRAVTLERVEREPNTFPILPLFYFESFEDTETEVKTEETLRTALRNTEISLKDNIELKDTLYVIDGKAHVIKTNGYSIKLLRGGPTAIKIDNGSTLTLIGSGNEGTSTVTGADSVGLGSAFRVLNNSNLILKGMNITDNTGKLGGGVYLENSTIEATNCRFKNNIGYENGGALYIDANSSATLNNCEIANNQGKDGGGIANLGKLTISGCKIKSNATLDNKGGGGGIWSSGDATITNTDITQNKDAVNGGGVTNHKNMTLTDCTIAANEASGWGGGLYIDGSNTVLDNTNVNNNDGKTGAGIHLRKGALTVKKATMNNNTSSEAGGALWANSGTTATLSDVTMTNNTCKTNGGALNSHGTLSLTRCTINGCTADNCGGGIYMDTSGTLTIQAGDISNCRAFSGGAGIHFHAGSLILSGGRTRITDSTTNGNSSNIWFREFKPIQIQGQFYIGSSIGITPPGIDNYNATSGYGQYNESAPADFFYCDNNQSKVDREENKEVKLITTMKSGDRNNYHVEIYLKVTDDADAWDYAYFHIYGKENKGIGNETLLHTSYDFHTSIDEDGKSINYTYDCDPNYFPSSVDVITSFGTALLPRDFEADVTVKINNVNVASHHVVHKVYGDERKNTRINIGGDKYPYPEDFEIDTPKQIDTSGVVTVSAVDQYRVKWTVKSSDITMENVSFPGEDTIEPVDSSGYKWRVSSTYNSIHHSTYNMTFKSGSNVYPTITKPINVKFVFLLHLSVVVNGKEVFHASGSSRDTVHAANLKVPEGYYIESFDDDTGIKYDDLSVTDEATGDYIQNFDFTFINDSVTLNAILVPNYYSVEFNKNGGTKVTSSGRVKSDVSGSAVNTSFLYDEPKQLPAHTLRRTGYTFVGWNTQPDGSGTMYEKDATVTNLTSKKGGKVILYAIWKSAKAASTSSSIFSDGTIMLYIGSGVLLAAIVTSVIYSSRKKKKPVGKE